MYKTALKNKFRYDTVRGQISTEDLFDLPLTGNNGFNLDAIAQAIYKQINDAKQSSPSFVTPNKNPDTTNLEIKLEIVKEIIEDKQELIAERTESMKRASELSKLEALLAEKKSDELKNLSAEELEARIKELKGE